MGPVQVGVRSQAQVHHQGDGPGLLGAAILAAISEGSKCLTQSPEQGGGCLCLPKLLEVCWPPRNQVMLALLPDLCFPNAFGGLFACFLPWPATQPPPLRLSAHHGVTAHKLLRSPTADATIPPISALLPPPHASSHSSPLARTAGAHTAVSRCPVRTAPGYNAHFPPVAAVASR